jgi:GNAT superfamily N-acetyltransferase
MTSERPELKSARVVLRTPNSQDVEVRLALGRHKEIIEAYGGTFDPTHPFTRSHAEAAIRFIDEQEHAWVIDAGRFIGHIRLHSVDQHDKRASLAIGIDDPAYLGKGYGTESVKLVLTYAFARGCIASPYVCWRAMPALSLAIASAASLKKAASAKRPLSTARGRTTSSWGCWTESLFSPEGLAIGRKRALKKPAQAMRVI